MQREEIINAKPIPTTMTALYAWGWITRAKSWVEGLAAMTETEWTNDDRLLADMGGGNTRRTVDPDHRQISGLHGQKYRVTTLTARLTRSIAICFWGLF